MMPAPMKSRIARYLASPLATDFSVRRALLRSAAVSAFVGLFLVCFKPFDLDSLQMARRDLWIASFALPCFAALALVEGARIATGRILSRGATWKVWQMLTFIALSILCIGLANHAYTCWVFGQKPCLDNFLCMLTNTALVGIFPALALVFLTGMFRFSQNEDAASGINVAISSGVAELVAENPAGNAGETVEITGSTGESAAFPVAELCYLKAEGNYVEVVSAKAGAKSSVLLRATLKDAESALAAKAPKLLRCHRSYIVNSARIRHAEGNAQGLTLTLDQPGMEIPVSRSYVPAFRLLK